MTNEDIIKALRNEVDELKNEVKKLEEQNHNYARTIVELCSRVVRNEGIE